LLYSHIRTVQTKGRQGHEESHPTGKKGKGSKKIIKKKEGILVCCSSCKTASGCTYPRELKRPVLQCEEFEGYEPRIVKTTVEKILSTANPKFGPRNKKRIR
jgi:hypothetical protein